MIIDQTSLKIDTIQHESNLIDYHGHKEEHNEDNQALMRNSEYPQLKSEIYLDLAAVPPCSSLIIDRFSENLKNNLYGNPHSHSSPSALLSKNLIDQMRHRVLKHFNVDARSYTVIFTSGATAALKLLSEELRWPEDKFNLFEYSEFSHTSVVGMREVFKSKSVDRIRSFTFEEMQKRLKNIDDIESPEKEYIDNFPSNDQVKDDKNLSSYGVYSSLSKMFGQGSASSLNDEDSKEDDNGDIYLVAFPTQCNFSGIRFPLNWINKLQRKEGSLVLLDASSYLSSSQLDLQRYPADFIVMSFYKIFGFPTGLGALLVKKSSEKYLRAVENNTNKGHSRNSSYFGGGTVASLTVDGYQEEGWVKRRTSLSARLEHGTIPILEIVGLKASFDVYDEKYNGSWKSIQNHTFYLAEFCRKELKNLKHESNSSRVCIIYPDDKLSDSDHALSGLEIGPIISFNLLNDDGNFVGYSEVMKLASVNQIHIRSGCFCNPGACQRFLKMASKDVIKNSEVHGHVCWDDHDLINGKPTGALRISFGIYNTIQDVQVFLQFIRKFYCTSVENATIPKSPKLINPPKNVYISEMYIYPIKSCGPISVKTWPVGPTGFLYDRYWVFVDAATGKKLSQKRHPKMTLIKPLKLDLNAEICILTVQLGDQSKIVLSDSIHDAHGTQDVDICGGTPAKGRSYEDQEAKLTEFFGFPCKIVCIQERTRFNLDGTSQLSFANDSQFLLVSRKSYEWMHEKLPNDQAKEHVDLSCFRPNIVVDGDIFPFAEDEWVSKKYVTFGEQTIEAQELCQRCQIICTHQETSEKSSEPLSTLAKLRKVNGKIMFGVHANHVPLSSIRPYIFSVGDTLKEL